MRPSIPVNRSRPRHSPILPRHRGQTMADLGSGTDLDTLQAASIERCRRLMPARPRRFARTDPAVNGREPTTTETRPLQTKNATQSERRLSSGSV